MWQACSSSGGFDWPSIPVAAQPLSKNARFEQTVCTAPLNRCSSNFAPAESGSAATAIAATAVDQPAIARLERADAARHAANNHRRRRVYR